MEGIIGRAFTCHTLMSLPVIPAFSSLTLLVGCDEVLYVCMYVIFIRCDKRTSNNKKHEKQSQNDVQYKAAKPKNYKTIKTISLDKAI